MDTMLVWYTSPEIWAAIIAGGFALFSGLIAVILFKKKNVIISNLQKEQETHKSELERKNIEIQAILNTQLEQVRIQFGNIYTKRLDVLYEACERMNEIDRYITIFVSYHHYDCLPNIDFSDACIKEVHACDKDCIVHYSDKIFEFRNYTSDTHMFFNKNEMFFPLETVMAHLKFISTISTLSAKSVDIVRDLNFNEKERAVECFKLFNDFDRTTITDMREHLISQYRFLIGVPPLIDHKETFYATPTSK